MLVKIKGNENRDIVFLSEANSDVYFNVIIILINYYGESHAGFLFHFVFYLILIPVCFEAHTRVPNHLIIMKSVVRVQAQLMFPFRVEDLAVYGDEPK